MIYLRRLAVLVGIPLWVVGIFVCIVLDVTGISYIRTGEFGGALIWWTEDLTEIISDWVWD